jgi:hypothetical protein
MRNGWAGSVRVEAEREHDADGSSAVSDQFAMPGLELGGRLLFAVPGARLIKLPIWKPRMQLR